MKNKSANWTHFTVNWQVFNVWFLGIALLMFSAGCQTRPTVKPPDYDADAGAKAESAAKDAGAKAEAAAKDEGARPEHSEPLVLREGDVLKISFPGASSLDTSQQIRRDGKITLPDGGEMDAAGKTTEQLEKDLIDHYASQLVTKEVTVTVQSSSFPIFVTGAVMKPGKVLADRPMTVLEAIMEAGGFDFAKANLKAVKVIRQNPAGSYTFDFKGLLQGEQPAPFYLQESDIIYVPEKFLWF